MPGVKKSILVRTGYGADVERETPEQIERAVVVDDLAGSGGVDFKFVS